jgi:diaminohydroxyphosphoribosylaminopyrimidine deaminase / 5-amino-6-(5-phosphoribosylamino)uracil reductase
MASSAEESAMRRAVALSAAALGTTNPNPCVGALVLDAGGNTVGEGITQPVGGDHAEVVALRAAGNQAAGGTVVVTLEPCSHTGRTVRCTDVIASAGVARVVYALADPHDVAAGGAQQLLDHGISVEGGLLAPDAEAVLGMWVSAHRQRRPFTTWKYAASLDGLTAAADGTSRWITGDQARRDVHRERFHADAVVVGIGTVLADDAALTVRDETATRQPLRVVVDSAARTPLDAAVLDQQAPTLVAVSATAEPARVEALRETGAEVIALPPADAGIDLYALAAALFERECYLVLLEGGAALAGSFIRAGLVDRVIGYYAPALLGAGTPLLGDLGIGTITEALKLSLDDVSKIGSDVRIVAHTTAGGT